MKKTGPSATRVLLHALDEGYDASAWHGTTLKGALRGVTARQAGWRPAPGWIRRMRRTPRKTSS